MTWNCEKAILVLSEIGTQRKAAFEARCFGSGILVTKQEDNQVIIESNRMLQQLRLHRSNQTVTHREAAT